LALIIRIHPRELPNKRENRTSANAERLRELLVNLPDNVIVNWPEDKLSIYDLLQRVDLVLSAWSTVLLEASLFGCPIILPRNPVSYYEVIADFVSNDGASYWDTILQQVGKPWTLERALKTFRWFWLIQLGSNVSLESNARRRPKFRELFAKGYKGGLKELRRRRINFRGEQVIVRTLLGTFDPLEDFEALAKLQKDEAPPQWGEPTKEEFHLVLKELKFLLSILVQSKNPRQFPQGKIQAMIRAAEGSC
jgi:hypothetical protein